MELFAGAGGLGVGLEEAGFRVALANEVERDFAETFRLNHPKTKVICGDVHEVDFVEELRSLGISKLDLLSGGPPCQGFSTVGAKNRRDPRNSLFYEYLRAVRETDPSCVLFENVSGFRRMYGGAAYATLLRELDALGYETTSAVLDASDYGLPQIRLRTIVLGWKSEISPLRLPEPSFGGEGRPAKRTLISAISDLPELGPGESKREYRCAPENDWQRRLRGLEPELTEHNCARYGERMRRILALIPEGGSVADLPETLRPKSYFANTYARLCPDRPAPTITRNFGTPSSSRCVHPFQNRALSTREGARLQSFPDAYRFYGGKTSKNLQIGNAVPPLLGCVLARTIREEGGI